MKSYLLVLSCCILLVCCKSQRISQKEASLLTLDTITDIQLLSDKGHAVYKTPSGKCYAMYFVPDSTDAAENSTPDSAASMTFAVRAASNRRCDSDAFDGRYRSEAKTSIYGGTIKKYTTLARFMNTLKDDEFMATEHNPQITTSSVRVIEENKTVRIARAYLYAFSKQTDEDYHLIFGTSNNPETARYFNAEISGVPADEQSPAYAILLGVWNDFSDHIGGDRCSSGYYFFDDPQRVELSGSLFFDKEHYNEAIGPANARPLSAWEIHPITKLKFY